MRIFVTGGTGYLGTYLLNAPEISEHEVLCLLRHEPAQDFAHSGVKGDLIHLEMLEPAITAFQPECIVHMGAVSAPQRCAEEPQIADQVNVVSTRFLADMARRLGARLIFLSSDWVFDATPVPEGGFLEDATPISKTVYGKGKLEAEKMVLSLGESGTVVRSSLMYGAELQGRRSTLAWLEEGLKGFMAVNLIEDEWRTPVFIEDVVQCILRVIEQEAANQVYHCAGPERMSRVEFGESYADCFGISKTLINRVKRQDIEALQDRPEDLSLNAQQTERSLGFQFKTVSEAFERIKQSRAAVSH